MDWFPDGWFKYNQDIQYISSSVLWNVRVDPKDADVAPQSRNMKSAKLCFPFDSIENCSTFNVVESLHPLTTSQHPALSCVHRLCIKGRPGWSWPQRMTTVSCVMPLSVRWQSLRHTIKARTTPRSCGSLKPSRTPVTCRSQYCNRVEFLIVNVCTFILTKVLQFCSWDQDHFKQEYLHIVKVKAVNVVLSHLLQGKLQWRSSQKSQERWHRVQTGEEPPQPTATCFHVR